LSSVCTKVIKEQENTSCALGADNLGGVVGVTHFSLLSVACGFRSIDEVSAGLVGFQDGTVILDFNCWLPSSLASSETSVIAWVSSPPGHAALQA
jgi:hypothetical protein